MTRTMLLLMMCLVSCRSLHVVTPNKAMPADVVCEKIADALWINAQIHKKLEVPPDFKSMASCYLKMYFRLSGKRPLDLL